MNLRTIAPITAVLAMLPNSAASIDCFSEITTDTKLSMDVTGCDCRAAGPKYALKVKGPARLDLNGHTVSCNNNTWINPEIFDDPADGLTPCNDTFSEDLFDKSTVIKVEGTGAEVKNGKVTTGNFGILVEGSHHKIEKLTVTGTANDAILLLPGAAYNEVRYCQVHDVGTGPNGDNNADGVDLAEGANHNIVKDNTIANVGDDGIDCDGSYNTIENNVISRDDGRESEDGITVRGFSNKIHGNFVTGMVKDCMDIKFTETDLAFDPEEGNECLPQRFLGGGHSVYGNKVSKCEKGIKISTSFSIISNNAVSEMVEVGIELDDGDTGCHGNTFTDNEVYKSGESGFEVEGDCAGNTFSGNIAFENGVSDPESFDYLADDCSGCKTHECRDNDFFPIAKSSKKSGKSAKERFLRNEKMSKASGKGKTSKNGGNANEGGTASPECILD